MSAGAGHPSARAGLLPRQDLSGRPRRPNRCTLHQPMHRAVFLIVNLFAYNHRAMVSTTLHAARPGLSWWRCDLPPISDRSRVRASRQASSESDPDMPNAPPPLVGAAALNATDEETLRGLVFSTVSELPGQASPVWTGALPQLEGVLTS